MIKLILVMGVFFTSLSSILTRLSTASPLLLVFYRLIFSVGLTLPLFLKNSRHELRKLQRRDILMSLAAGVCLGFHFSFYLSSLSYTSIASSTTLTDTEVFFVALLGVVFLREKLCPATCWRWRQRPAPRCIPLSDGAFAGVFPPRRTRFSFIWRRARRRSASAQGQGQTSAR